MFENVCVFCEGIYPESITLCPKCDDYKGLMTIPSAVKAYPFLAHLLEEV